ncbi:MAG TPA: NAD-dependent epimerase/dehydratase family protein [Terriglobales bacterium]|nr:NAD-dependent epimerase/dehydratase family protein [Terriglobales bacterium]
MKVLIIGGTGFIGPSTVAHLVNAGHSITVFHRGKTAAPSRAEQIAGDHHRLADYRPEFARRNFDLVIAFILSSGRQAQTLIDTFRGITGRVVGLSSMDVYRAMGLLHGTETGPLQPLPLTEESELRRNRNTYSPEAMKRVQQVYPWTDNEYDKIPVEEAVLGDRALPGTVLRLPMVYGPGDPLHRFHHILKRMDDGRRHIIFSEDFAAWRTPRGYVENVGAAIALAATADRATGRTFNICEEESYSELEWAGKIAGAVGWKGEFVVMPREKAPQHLIMPGRIEQHLMASSERIRRELGYREPVSRDQAFRSTIEWERAHKPAQPMYAPFRYAEEDAALAKLKATA